MYVIKSNRQTNSYTVRKINRVTQVVRVGRRGLQGETGPQGPKGDQGDPATNLVQSVNGKQGVVVLNATDVGADPTGSASQALQDAKDYTDSEVSTLDSSLATVAKTGSYNDLSNKPTIPSIAGLATEAQVQDVQDNLDAHEADTANPHNVTKAQVGLGNVENLAPADMPVSTATQTALNAKANASDTVNLTGNQTIAGVKTFSSSPIVPTATTNTQAVNKDQMDTANALKVNKAGDTMTGALSIQSTAILPLALTNTGPNSSGGGAGILAGANLVDTINNSDRLGYMLFSGFNSTTTRNSAGFLAHASEAWSSTKSGSYMDIVTTASGTNSRATAARFHQNKDLTVMSSLQIGGLSGPLYTSGTGFPNGVVSAPVGSIYIDTAITNAIAIWYKKTGTASTGWIPLSLSSTPPATATSTGISGQTAYDSNYYYICVATNTWKRTPLSSW